MKIKKFRKNCIYIILFYFSKFQNHLGVLTRATHTWSQNQLGAILSLKDNRLDGRTSDGRTDAGASPHRTMISASSILAELKMALQRPAIIWVLTHTVLFIVPYRNYRSRADFIATDRKPSAVRLVRPLGAGFETRFIHVCCPSIRHSSDLGC